MRTLRETSKPFQLDLLDAPAVAVSVSPQSCAAFISAGQPLMLTVTSLYEDPNNPRTVVPDAELEELAEDIRQHGILQAIVVHPTDVDGRYRIHFGAMRLRAARRAGLTEVPVVVRDAPTDPYAQFAENQKRHGLTALDIAPRFASRVRWRRASPALDSARGTEISGEWPIETASSGPGLTSARRRCVDPGARVMGMSRWRSSDRSSSGPSRSA